MNRKWRTPQANATAVTDGTSNSCCNNSMLNDGSGNVSHSYSTSSSSITSTKTITYSISNDNNNLQHK